MSDRDGRDEPLVAEIIGQETTYSVDDVSRCCRVETTWVAELVEHGIVDATGQRADEWRFTEVAVVRIAKARRLGRDLDLNLPGIALALDLLEEIEGLRARIRAVEGRRA